MKQKKQLWEENHLAKEEITIKNNRGESIANKFHN